MRIAVVSDTHQAGNGWGSPPELLDALRKADLILHCGDLDVLGILDHLETVAPVLAVRGYSDPHELRPAVGSSDESRMLGGSLHLDRVGPGDRLAEWTRVVQVAGLRIGVVHDIQWPGPHVGFTPTEALEFPKGSVHELMKLKFGQDVDLVCFGHTHAEYIGWHQGMLFVNPGSTTRPPPTQIPGNMGTLAYLYINNGVVSVEIRRLRRNT